VLDSERGDISICREIADRSVLTTQPLEES
jgi:hypothetical protein